MHIHIRPSFPGQSRPQAGVDVGASSEISNLWHARESAESARRAAAAGLWRATIGAATAEPTQLAYRASQIQRQNESKNAFGFKKKDAALYILCVLQCILYFVVWPC